VLPHPDIPIDLTVFAFVNQGLSGLKVVGSHFDFYLIPAKTGEDRGFQVFGLELCHIRLFQKKGAAPEGTALLNFNRFAVNISPALPC
jgi:hypothetical protein